MKRETYLAINNKLLLVCYLSDLIIWVLLIWRLKKNISYFLCCCFFWPAYELWRFLYQTFTPFLCSIWLNCLCLFVSYLALLMSAYHMSGFTLSKMTLHCLLDILPAAAFTATILLPYQKGPSITTPCCEPCKVKLPPPTSDPPRLLGNRRNTQICTMHIESVPSEKHTYSHSWCWTGMWGFSRRMSRRWCHSRIVNVFFELSSSRRHLYDNPLSFVGASAFQNLSDLHSLWVPLSGTAPGIKVV